MPQPSRIRRGRVFFRRAERNCRRDPAPAPACIPPGSFPLGSSPSETGIPPHPARGNFPRATQTGGEPQPGSCRGVRSASAEGVLSWQPGLTGAEARSRRAHPGGEPASRGVLSACDPIKPERALAVALGFRRIGWGRRAFPPLGSPPEARRGQGRCAPPPGRGFARRGGARCESPGRALAESRAPAGPGVAAGPGPRYIPACEFVALARPCRGAPRDARHDHRNRRTDDPGDRGDGRSGRGGLGVPEGPGA